METASSLFENVVARLQAHYATLRFFMERDVVWTVQTYLIRSIEEARLPYHVFSEYPILPGNRRSICTDLAILNSKGIVEVAAEFKYEPSHLRKDIMPGKFPVTIWEEITKDVTRIQQFVATGKSQAAYSLLIDEGNFYRQRIPPSGSKWITWQSASPTTQPISVLWSHIENGRQPISLI